MLFVDGGASSPATTTPSGFDLSFRGNSGRQIRKDAFFHPGNGISLLEKGPARGVHAAAVD